MFDDFNFKVPVSLFKELDAHPAVSPKDIYYYDKEIFIDKTAFDEKRNIWNNYIKTFRRSELFPIGSIVCNSSDKWPRRANIIVDIVFQRYRSKLEISDTVTEVKFWYRLMCLDNILSLDDFIKTGRIRSVHNEFETVDSNVSRHCECFDSLVCSSIEDFFETYKQQIKEIKKMIIGKHFLGWDANDAFIFDESRSMFTLKIKDVRPYIKTIGFELIPEDDIIIVQRKRKHECRTLCEKYYNSFIKYKEKKLLSPIVLHIDPKDNKLNFKKGYVYSDKKSISYIAHIFGSGYKYANYDIKIDWDYFKRDEFIMPAVTYADETVKIVEKYKSFLKEKYIQWDYQMKGKTVKDFADFGKQRWILFNDGNFAVQKSRVVKRETYYRMPCSSAMLRFKSIHGFFKELTNKDNLNKAGEMFVSHKIFTREEIISISKSSL